MHFDGRKSCMCLNIKTLFNFDPPATDDEIRASAIQFVRKLSGYKHPSKTNEKAFNLAVSKIEVVVRELIGSLETSTPAKNREVEAAKVKMRFSKQSSASRQFTQKR